LGVRENVLTGPAEPGLAGSGGSGNIYWPADCQLGGACGPGSLHVAQFIDIKTLSARAVGGVLA